MTDKTDPTPPTPDPAAPHSGGKPSGAEAHTYDLVPDDPATGPSRIPKLDAPGLTDDFDEDADFDHDPAMPKAPPPKVENLLLCALALLWPAEDPPYARATSVQNSSGSCGKIKIIRLRSLRTSLLIRASLMRIIASCSGRFIRRGRWR